MVGLAGFLVAGAAQGVGNSIKEQAIAKREAMLEEIRNGRLIEREERSRSFQQSEREASQAFSSAENDKTRKQSADQAAAAREASGDLITGEDGTTYSRTGSTAKPLTTPDGKPIKAVTGRADKNAPADVATAEWLIQKKIAKTEAEAWEMVKSRDTTAKPGPADIEKMVEAAVKTEFEGSFGAKKPEEIQAARERNRARIMKNLGMDDDAAKGAAPAGAVSRPSGVDDATLIEQGKQAIKRGADAAAVKDRLKAMGVAVDNLDF